MFILHALWSILFFSIFFLSHFKLHVLCFVVEKLRLLKENHGKVTDRDIFAGIDVHGGSVSDDQCASKG